MYVNTQEQERIQQRKEYEASNQKKPFGGGSLYCFCSVFVESAMHGVALGRQAEEVTILASQAPNPGNTSRQTARHPIHKPIDRSASMQP